MTFASPLLAASLVIATAHLSAQEDQGYWRAASKTASSITGDIALRQERLTINYMPFTIASIRHVDAAEASSVFDLPADGNPGGEIYRVNIPSSRKLLHKNTLCGAEDVTYMLTVVDGKALQVAFFSGAALPKLTREAGDTSTVLCGTYSYHR